jgi:CHAT domain-containing protein/predicted negative regulator of RcsB-dependent stress response
MFPIHQKIPLWLLSIVTIILTLSSNLFWQKDYIVTANSFFREDISHTIAKEKQDSSSSNEGNLLQKGKQLYDTGEYIQAAIVLEKAAENYQNLGKPIELAVVLSNLCLVYQELGDWQKARKSIAKGLEILELNNTPKSINIIAQSLDIQGKLLLAIGNPEAALNSWEKSGRIYLQLGDITAEIGSRIARAKALQDLGFYHRAVKILTEVESEIKKLPDDYLKIVGLRSLGDALQSIGENDRALEFLQQSLDIANKSYANLALKESKSIEREIGIIYLSLGNTYRVDRNFDAALNNYQQVINSSAATTTKFKARLNSFTLAVERQQITTAASLLTELKQDFATLPANRSIVYGKLDLALTLIDNNRLELWQQINPKELTIAAISDAKEMRDKRTEAYGLGTLGKYYEREQNFTEALKFTQEAIILSCSIDAKDILYLWQWQLGRIYKTEGKIELASAAYDTAIDNLKSLRQDLVAVDREVQFNFRDRVEPIYRQAVELLFLDRIDESKLDKARRLIEALQLAELDNFFREACLDDRPVILDEIVDRDNLTTAIIYPIILENSLEVIVKLSQRPLSHYKTELPRREIEETLTRLQAIITEPDRNKETRLLSEKIYNWTIAPFADELQQSGVRDLIFIPDSSFRNLPFASLYDGKQYLIEKYATAVNPALQLLTANNSKITEYKALVAGLTEPPPAYDRFPPLPEVKSELDAISSVGITATELIDSTFTSDSLAASIKQSSYQVVHLATHGQFSSQANDTFILAADGPIDAVELEKLLQSRDRNLKAPIELLVLSACETAEGDNRAALGLAGMAVKAGAKSTLASLWQIDDRSTAILIGEFYRELVAGGVSKAEALRRAQINLIQNYPDYNRPMYWAAYVLVGSWL